MAKVIFLRSEDEALVDALERASGDQLRSKNSYALAVLEDHLRAAGYLE